MGGLLEKLSYKFQEDKILFFFHFAEHTHLSTFLSAKCQPCVYDPEKLLVFFRPVEVEQSILEDLRNRAQLNNLALLSVSFYTFLNTHNG